MTSKLAQEVFDQGYCVLEGFFDKSSREQIISILHQVWLNANRPSMGGRFGYVLHPVLKFAPDLAPFYAQSEIVKLMAEILQDEVRLAHSGAILCDESRNFCDWHCHLNGSEFNQWYPKKNTDQRINRLLCNVYLHGSTSETGELLVYPRKTTDSWQIPFENLLSEWEGQSVVTCPPGSAVIFDTALLHAARQPTQAGLRYIWGGHYQGRNNLTPHREDNWYESNQIEQYRQEYPLFGRLTDPKYKPITIR
ncbi:hypothetical protein CMK19_07170 [Candidatus Poribacteria bacterium]|jgi:hypothetical protein|nr:hypothetical protein [Candidatus Poribacteria bacterium]